ncbi:MAG: DUF3298 and DUF4163 domain-containing protein [Armatimonadetes bacterium]|nr:DUF3298 and DUF4163 domain-containing protein [Armatimonadota bacterium]
MKLRAVLTALSVLTALVMTDVWAAPAPGQIPVTWKTLSAQKKGQWTAKIVYPRFGGDSPLAITANKTLEEASRKALDEFRTEAEENFDSRTAVAAFETESLTVLSVATEQIISLYIRTYEFTGGAHPNTFYQPMTFGYANGKASRLKLQDLFKKDVNALQIVSELVIPKLRSLNASAVTDGEVTALTPQMAESFVVTPNGLTFLFEPYAVGAYAEGSFFVKIPFADLRANLLLGGPADFPLKA